MQNLIGQTIDRYHILEQIGEGGMAVVYKAYDTRLEREVAIKIIRTDAFPRHSLERMLQRFNREAKTLASLQHTNIVGIIDYGEFQNTPYLVMEYLPGGTLKKSLGKPIPYKQAAALLIPIAHALDYAHKQGIIHRDVKPSNIMINLSGNPLLTDFGVAKLIEEHDELHTLTGTGVGIGTPEYMAPEQGLGKQIDGRADIYSLGIIFYELITGRKPYSAETPMAVILKHMTDPLPAPSRAIKGLPVAVERVMLTALAKKPENRYQNMSLFARALEAMVSSNNDDSTETRRGIIPFSWGGYTKESKTELIDTANIKGKNVFENKIIIFGLSMLVISAIILTSTFIFPHIKKENVTLSTLMPTTVQMTIPPTQYSTNPVPVEIVLTPTIIITPIPSTTPTSPSQLSVIKSENIKNLSLTYVIPLPVSIIQSVFSFSPDNNNIAIAHDNSIGIYSLSDGKEVTNIPSENGSITSLKYSPDGDLLAAGYDSKIVNIWKLQDNKQLYSFAGHKESVMDIAFSPDNKSLASGSTDNTIVIWDLTNGNQIDKFSYGISDVYSVAYSPNGRTLAAGSGNSTVHLYQMVDQVLKGHKGKVLSIAFSPNGEMISSVGDDNSTIVWEIQNGITKFKYTDKQLDRYDFTDTVFSSDGSLVTSSAWDKWTKNLNIYFWNISDGTLLFSLFSKNSFGSNIEFSKDGSMFASYTNLSGGGVGIFKVAK